jgi:hypothetical protein
LKAVCGKQRGRARSQTRAFSSSSPDRLERGTQVGVSAPSEGSWPRPRAYLSRRSAQRRNFARSGAEPAQEGSYRAAGSKSMTRPGEARPGMRSISSMYDE